MPRALIIDDDAGFLEGIGVVVAQEGFKVSSAGSLEDARAQFALAPADLVLLDLSLPDGDGISYLRELKETSSAEVILLSGVATLTSAIEALRLGALDYLTKPLDTQRLRS